MTKDTNMSGAEAIPVHICDTLAEFLLPSQIL